MLKQKDKLTALILVSIGFICADTSPLSGETINSLNVTDNAKIEHLHVESKSHFDDHLDVNQNVSIQNHLYVGGSQENKRHLNVSGDQHNDGKLTVDNNGIFEKKLIVQDNGILKKKLVVEKEAVIQEDVIAKKNVHLAQKLLVDQPGTFNANLTVNGLLHGTWKADVEGDIKIAGNEHIGKTLTIDGCKTLRGDLCVGKNIYVKENFQMPNDLLIGGNMLVAGTESLSGSLNVGEGANVGNNLNINGSENITGNLNISGNLSVEGSLCCQHGQLTSNGLTAQQASIDLLTVNKNASVNNTLFVNEIDSTTPCQTTFFGGHVSIDNGNKVFVRDIAPAGTQCCQQQPSDCSCPTTSTDGVTIINAAMAVNPTDSLLVNSINPVKKESNCFIPFNDGVTIFKADTAVHDKHKMLVNWIDPVVCDKDCLVPCHSNDENTTFFSGNVAVSADKKMLVNVINPIVTDSQEDWICDLPDIHHMVTKATNFFSGNVAIHKDHTLFVNEINPVLPTQGDDCTPDPCAATNFSGGISIKNGHFYGQLDQTTEGKKIRLQCAQPDFFNIPYFDFYENTSWIAGHLGFPVTECQPVLRLNFKNIDPQGELFPQGAWVKLNVTGRANLNLMECSLYECSCPRTLSTDIFSELYFFIGAGHAAPCSSLIGSTTTLNPAHGINSFSGFGCKVPFLGSEKAIVPSNATKNGKWGHSLFGTEPTIDSPSAVTLIGTTATSALQPQVVDILLMGMLQMYDINNLIIQVNNQNLRAVDFIDPDCPFVIDNVSIFYEIISPNLDPENPPCYPAPLLDCCVYEKACRDLTSTFTTLAPSSYDEPDLYFDQSDLVYVQPF